MAADTTGDVDEAKDQSGADSQLAAQSDESFKKLDPDLRQRLIDTTTDPAAKARYQKLAAELQPPPPSSDKSALQRTGDKGDSALTVTGKKEPEKPVEEPSLIQPPPKDRPPEAPAPTGQIFGRTTIFHYNHDGSRDKEDPGSTGFFGANLDDPSLVGAAVPVDILEAQFGKFTQKLPDGTYAALDTPEAREIIQRIKASHVTVQKPDGSTMDVPIVDIQGSYKNWHRTLDLTLGAWKQLGLNDDTYLGYSIVDGAGNTMTANMDWSDTSPLAKFYQQGGKELAGLSDSKILELAKAEVAPDMPQEEYDRAMRDPHGEDDLKKYNLRPKQAGEELPSIQGSSYAGLSQDDLVKKVYSDWVKSGDIDPAKVDLSQLRDRLFPNPGFSESVRQTFNLGASAPRVSQMAHEESSKFYGALDTALTQWDDFIYGRIPGFSKARDSLDAFVKEHAGGHNYFAELTNYLHGLLSSAQKSQQQAAQVDAQRAAQGERTIPEKARGAVVGGLAGLAFQLPELAFGMGEAKAAAVAAGLVNGSATFGREAQNGQSTAFIDGLRDFGFGYTWRYAMNSPAGFGTMLGATWLSDTGEDTFQKVLRGEKIDPVDFGIHSVIDLGASVLGTWTTPKETFERKGVAPEERFQRAEEERRSALARQVLGSEDVSEKQPPWYTPGPVVTRPVEREAFTPSELTLAAGELPAGASTSELARRAGLLKPPPEQKRLEVHLADPEAGLDWKRKRDTIIRRETKSMLEAKENGELNKAVQHGNNALAHLEPEERQQLARNLVRYTEKFTDNGATPGEEPKEPMTEWERKLIQFHTGLKSLEVVEDRPIDDATEINNHLHVEGLETDSEPLPELHAGLSFAPVIRSLRKLGTAIYESDPSRWLRERVAPASFGIAAKTTESVARRSRLEAETTIGLLNAELAHEHRMNELLKGGEKVAVRQRFFAKFSRSVQKAMLIAWEKGQHVGNHYAQEIFKFHADLYKAIEQLEKRFGFIYKATDNYIYHLIKGGREAQDRFERWYNNKVTADPKWTHRRTYSQLEDLFKAGFELQTYNPEELLQRRFFSSQMAINKVNQMRELERANIAWRVDRPGLTRTIKDLGGSEGELIRRAPNGERYYVRKEAQFVLNHAWDMGSIYSHRFFGPSFTMMATLKANSIGVKLLGLAHAAHMLTMNFASFSNSLIQAGIHGKFSPALFRREFTRMGEGLVGNSAEVKFLKTGKGWEKLSPEQKLKVEWWHRGGANIRNIEVQQRAFSTWAHQTVSNLMGELEKKGVPRGTGAAGHGAITILGTGFKAAGSVMDWQFHSLVPQIKWNHFQSLVDGLLRNHPELLETKNDWKFGRELTKLGKETEYRMGEMFYDNMLWPNIWKQLGSTLLLSFGWQVGGWRIHADAIHDTSSLVGKVLEDHKLLTRDDVSERMTFLVSYYASSIIKNALTQYVAVSVWNYLHPDKKQDPIPHGSLLPDTKSDFYMPRTGALDEQGRPKRLAPIEYTREAAILGQYFQEKGPLAGPLTMAQHKLNPVLSTFAEEVRNENFYGKEIADPNDVVEVGGIPFWNGKQWQDRLSHIVSGLFGPIGFSHAPETQVGPFHFGQRQGSWADVLWGVIGDPSASRAVSNTQMENEIFDTKHRVEGTKRTDLDNQKYAQYDALRQAIKSKDIHAQHQAEDELFRLGVSDKYLKGFVTHLRNHPDETAVQHIWRGLGAEEQEKLLVRNPQEREKFYKMLTPEEQESVLRIMMSQNPGQVQSFRLMTDRKVLDKLEREARGHHVSLLQR